MEPIILKGVPPERFNKSCYVCEEQGRETKATTGACMQCNKNGCKLHFHVTCAQSQGLLCEEQGSYMDNVKYCGYCSAHYKKLKKDSHIKIIPAFKPIPAENATPENTPEKGSHQRTDRRKDRLNRTSIQTTSPSVLNVSSPSTCASSPFHQYSQSMSTGGKDSVTDIKSTGKFTTANFRETTITPSPANFGDFSSPGSTSSTGGGGNTPTQDRERDSRDKRDEKEQRWKESKKLEKSRSSDGSLSVGSDYEESDGRETSGVLGSPSGRSVAAVKESKFSPYSSLSGDKLSMSKGILPNSLPSTTAPATTAVVTNSATSSVSSMATAVTTTTAATVQTTTTSSSHSAFSYSFESFLNSHNETENGPKLDFMPAKRPRSRSNEKSEKKKSKKMRNEHENTPSLVAMGAPSLLNASNKTKTVKDLLNDSAMSTPPPVSPQPPGGSKSKKSTGKRKKTNSESSSVTGMPTLQHQGVLDNESFSPATSGSTSLTLSNLQRQGTASDLGDGFSNGPSVLVGPSRSFGNKSLVSPNKTQENQAQLPTSMEQLLERQWDQGSQFLMEQGQHFDIASLLNCLHQLRQENQRLEEHILMLTARRDQLLAVNARLSLPLIPVNAVLSTANSVPNQAGTAANSQGTSPEGRSPRINNYMPQDVHSTSHSQDPLSGASGRNVSRSPTHSQSAPTSVGSTTQNHLPTSHGQSPAASSSSHHVTQASPEGTVNSGVRHSIPTSVANLFGMPQQGPSVLPPLPPGLTEQQRQQIILQQQQMLMSAALTPEQRQQLYQMTASQQLPAGLLTPLHHMVASSTSATMSALQRGVQSAAQMQVASGKPGSDKAREKS